MASYPWNDGRLLTLSPGDTATCQGGLNQQQIYCVFFYNSAQNDTGAMLNVAWNNSNPPLSVTVPGTTMNLGLAAMLFVSGNDTNTLSVSMIPNQPGAQVQCFIGSVKMPMNYSGGINNTPLEADGQLHPFNAFTRYYAVPQSHWYSAQLQSNVNQFVSVQFTQQTAQVIIVNAPSDPSPTLYYAGTTAKGQVKVNFTYNQTYQWYLQGNGEQMVWINADSIQNSLSASISLQSLSSLYQPHKP
ncbi:hypothetical protein [Myxococcus qinghaiensis]|uniref:hypothetical protein n=1 Tax=Myxococcus qinghaiensis TaxID=2906758 RepID=UPI0020A7FE7E|nr:hypothetical protein [Myxococcus qinghaiensis]MCP3163959.1 hypothetical protein [Myxococcus qinghaiensis]